MTDVKTHSTVLPAVAAPTQGLDTIRLDSDSAAQDILQALSSKGAALLSHGSEKNVLRVAGQLGTLHQPRHGNGTNISRICEKSDLAAQGHLGYSVLPLYPHTDRSAKPTPPVINLLICESEASEGGEALLVNGQAVYQTLRDENPSLLKLVQDSKCAVFQDAQDLYHGPIFQAQPGSGRINLRFRKDPSGFFASPLAERLLELTSVIDRHCISMKCAAGQGYVVDNTWWLHGRNGFSGNRMMIRALIETASLTHGFPSPPKNETLVLFDIDGTLLGSHHVSVHAFEACLSALLNRPISLTSTELKGVALNGRTDLGLITELLLALQVPKHDVDAKANEFLTSYPSFLAQSIAKSRETASGLVGIKACEGVADVLQSLGKICAVRVALLTGNSKDASRLKIQAAGLPVEAFDWDVSAFGDVTQDRNELPKIAWKRAKERKVLVDRTLLVGDTPRDVECGRTNGVPVLAVATGSYDVAALKAAGATLAVSQLNVDDFMRLLKTAA